MSSAILGTFSEKMEKRLEESTSERKRNWIWLQAPKGIRMLKQVSFRWYLTPYSLSNTYVQECILRGVWGFSRSSETALFGDMLGQETGLENGAGAKS